MGVSIASDLVSTQGQLGPSDTTNPVFKLYNARIPKVYGTEKTTTVNIGHAFTVGHGVNGIVGTANGVDGSQLTIGSASLGATTLSRVKSLGDEFVEALRDNTYVDTDLTTATVNTTSYTVEF